LPEKCRNCYDLETTIRDLENAAAQERIERRTLLQTHAEQLAVKDRQIREADEHNHELMGDIQRSDRFYQDCKAILLNPSMHSMLDAVLRDYDRNRQSGAVPVVEAAVA
jgi:hypothetical protein